MDGRVVLDPAVPCRSSFLKNRAQNLRGQAAVPRAPADLFHGFEKSLTALCSLAQVIENKVDLRSFDSRKPFQKLPDRRASLQILDQCGNGNAGTLEYPLTANHMGTAFDCRAARQPITDSGACRSPWSERVGALENLVETPSSILARGPPETRRKEDVTEEVVHAEDSRTAAPEVRSRAHHRELARSLGIAASTVSDYVRRASAAGFT